ncbi:MAG: 30S ribosomal protein S18 [Chloroflexi bacterium]|nr:30S ribosomal protein S18 [Chloroflexota bacterium]
MTAQRRGPYRGGAQRRRTGKRRFFPRRKVCFFCAEKVTGIDYKDAGKLRRYLSDRGKMSGRGRTGTCARHQRLLAVAIKRARFLALLPYTAAHIRQLGAVGVKE